MEGKYRYYIAYGSNLNQAQMSLRCSRAVPIGTAYLKGYRLAFRTYLTIEKDKRCKVPVVVWRVEESDIKSLDLYEGYPSFYYKEEIRELKVTDFRDNEEELNCFVYIMNEDVRDYKMPTGQYLATCLEGCQRFNLSSDYIGRALEYTRSKLQIG